MALRNIVRSRFIYPVATLLGIVLAFSGCAAVQSSSSSRTTPETVSVTVTPPTASVQVSKTQQFAAAVTNTTNTAVTWQVNGTTGSTIAGGCDDNRHLASSIHSERERTGHGYSRCHAPDCSYNIGTHGLGAGWAYADVQRHGPE